VQRRAEEARRESEARYRKLFEYAPDGILIADGRSRYLDANESICRMLGYTREELIGKDATDIIDPAEAPEIEPAIDSIRNKAEHLREWRFRRKDGTTFQADVMATMMPDGNLMGMIRDVTERKLAQEERQKRERAEAADHIKSAFLATMSHELRTPLNSIIGFTGIMLQGLAGPLNAEQGKQLDMVRSSARHLLALVNDVLDISKIEAGQLEVERVPFDLRGSLDKAAALIGPQAEAKGLGLRLRLASGLGEAVGDARRFEQILLNLLTNAVKFTDHGEITLAAEWVGDFRPDGAALSNPGVRAVRIAVSDTGTGIRSQDLPALFQPFRQVDSGLSRQHEGSGLGLAICRRLAGLMGGAIGVASEWGKGSTFTVTLPLPGKGGMET
jgi:PAS domain S-box-containing protein